MPSKSPTDLAKSWPLTYAATLGSSARRRGIFLEVRARLSPEARTALMLDAGALTLQMPATEKHHFAAACRVISEAVDSIESLPVIPREIEDILQISSTERRRWLKDGRLPSLGTRTVRLRGRDREVTFHVFDPRVVEELLDRDTVSAWRADEAEAAVEKRRRATSKTKVTRELGKVADAASRGDCTPASPGLLAWDEFERSGPLRKSGRS